MVPHGEYSAAALRLITVSCANVANACLSLTAVSMERQLGNTRLYESAAEFVYNGSAAESDKEKEMKRNEGFCE